MIAYNSKCVHTTHFQIRQTQLIRTAKCIKASITLHGSIPIEKEIKLCAQCAFPIFQLDAFESEFNRFLCLSISLYLHKLVSTIVWVRSDKVKLFLYRCFLGRTVFLIKSRSLAKSEAVFLLFLLTFPPVCR